MNARVVLEDGKVFEGKAFGAEKTVVGQIHYYTGVVGYEVIVSDPAMYNCIAVMTYPLIGNYGISTKELESNRGYLGGIVVNEISQIYSSWTAEKSLPDFLKEQDIPGISNIDTRELTLHIRNNGEQKAIITTGDEGVSDLLTMLHEFKNGAGLISKVSIEKPKLIEGEGSKKYSVALLDLGVTKGIINQLLMSEASVTVYPYKTEAEEILKGNHDGLVLAGGPGYPRNDVDQIIRTIKNLMGKMPIFGVEQGHLILGEALGAKVVRMKVGHHGANYPVKRIKAGADFAITWQNHSYVMDRDSIDESNLCIIAENTVDGTIEGIKSKKYPAFSVQYRPLSREHGTVSSEIKAFFELL